jgi:GAF domain-containing protein
MFNRLKSFLTPPVYADEQKTRTARRLNNFLIVLIALLTVQWLVRLQTDPIVSENMIIIAGLVILSVALLFVLRRGHVQLSSYILVITSWLAMSLLSWLNDGVNDTAFLVYIVIILAASLLSGWRLGLLITGLSIAAGWGFVYGESTGLIVPYATPASSKMIDFTVIFALSGFLLYLLMDGLQRALQDTRESNRSLQSLSDKLEARVEERTRDLTLAVETGHKISQMRDLDRLFKDAIDRICEQFNLYYGQIYLVDDREQRLVIRAGTGSVGAELMRRAHFLSLSSSSINGLAVIEQRAIIVADTQENPIFRPNSLLPDTRSEMAVPLMLNERVVGVLNLQDNQPETFSLETLPVFLMVADQLAVAMQNARLFTEIAQARAEVDAAARRMAREGWGEYLDGINQGERIGVQYNLTAVSPLTDEIPAASPDSGVLQVPVTVADEPVGMIHIEAGDERFWTEEKQALVTAVARQVGQQVENLRLLAETDRYRNEAEQALRRMRREAWGDYLDEQLEVSTGFIYDQQQVKPLTDEEQIGGNGRNGEMIHQSLEVQGESFGELVVDSAADPQTEALVAAVAERLSGHLDNLRLSAQTEKALTETAEQARRLAALNEIGRDLSAVTDVDETFAVLSRHMASVIPHDSLSFALAKPNGNSAKILAIINGQPVTMFEDQPIAGTVVEVATKQRQLIYLADINKHDYADTNVMAQRGGIRSAMIAPLITARGVLGGIDLMSNKVDGFDAQDQTLLQQIATLVASTLESQQLFAEAQKQAQKERLVNIVSQKIQSTVTVESALETTITELGKALQARYTKAELSLVKESIQES